MHTSITHYLIAALALISIVLPSAVLAENVVRTNEVITIAEDQAVQKDFYALGRTISNSGQVLGDMYVSGQEVVVTGKVFSDLGAFAGSVQVHGVVEDDVRAIAGEVTIAGEVKGDVFVMGSSLTLLPEAKVAGDIIFYGDKLSLAGTVSGGVFGSMSSTRIDGAVKSVDIKTNKLTLGSNAAVEETVQYKSAQEFTRAPEAQVGGEIVYNRAVVTDESFNFTPYIYLFIMLSFCGLLLSLLLRKRLPQLLAPSSSVLVDGAIGLLFFMFGLAAMLPFVATLVLAPLGFLLFFVYLATLLGAFLLLPVFAGDILQRKMPQLKLHQSMSVLLGALVIVLLLLVPVIGVLIVMVYFVILLGRLLRKSVRLIQ